MNILIINQPPNNRGDESAHKGLIRTLLNRMTNVEIRVLFPNDWQETVRQYNVHEKRVKYIFEPIWSNVFTKLTWLGIRHPKSMYLVSLHKTMSFYRKEYKWADMVLCAPGGICMGGFQDWKHLFRLCLAKFYRKKLAYYGRSFGPFPVDTPRQKSFKKASVEMLNYFSFLSIRDKKTEVLAKEMGLHYVPTVDSAFLDSPQVSVPYDLSSILLNKKYMVFVPNYLRWHYAYKDGISENEIYDFYLKVIDIIVEHDKESYIVMLPQTFAEDSYEYSDLSFFRNLADKAKNPNIIVVPDCYGSDIQQMVIRKAQYLIGARYHSIVFSINQAIPFVALSYEHKIAGMLDTLGLSKNCIDISTRLLSKEGREDILKEITDSIRKTCYDKSISEKAKHIAAGCMDKFITFVQSDVQA